MVRTWNKFGGPDWVEPLTEDERQELEDYALCGILPFARLPEGADRSNLVPMPFPDQVRRRKGLRKLQAFDLVCLNPSSDAPPAPPVPFELSKRQIKAADREDGALLMLPWPWCAGLKRPSHFYGHLSADSEKRQAALALVGATCKANSLVIRGITLRWSSHQSRHFGWPDLNPYLIVHVIHERWPQHDPFVKLKPRCLWLKPR
jgi:hypothetical protein